MPKLGVVDPGPAPVDPLKNQTAPGIGVVVAREIAVKPEAPPPGLGTVRTDTPVVSVAQVAPEVIGQVKQVVITTPPPQAAPAPVGVIQDQTPTLSATPVREGAMPVGIVVPTRLEAPFTPAPVAPAGKIEIPPPIYPPAAALPPVNTNLGKVVDNIVSVQPPVPTDKPQVVVSVVQKPKEIIERPVEISPFRRDE